MGSSGSGSASSGSGSGTSGQTGGSTGTHGTGSGAATTGSHYGQQTTPLGPAEVGDGGGLGTGIVNLADGGGVTLGSQVNFNSFFAYLSNSAQAAGDSFVSRINTKTGQEEARYPSVMPLDNGGKNLCQGKTASTCLVDLDTTYYDNAPSRTVVDLNGGVFVANRGQCDWAVCTADMGNLSYNPNNPDSNMVGAVQGSVTYIANRVDHPDQCAPRCQNRKGWNLPDGGPAIFSSGLALPNVGTIPATEVLSPNPGGGSTATLATFSPDVVNHPCLDNGAHDPTDVTDPTNYDDCARFTIPLGAPNGYDLKVQSAYTDRFAPRGIAISKNCGALGSQLACDLYVGLTEPASETSQIIHLGFQNNFGVVSVTDSAQTNYALYGAAIDCDGLLWAGHAQSIMSLNTSTDQLASSWKYNDGAGNVKESTEIVDTQATNTCNTYGVAVDLQQHFWAGGVVNQASGTGVGACAFDYGTFFNTPSLHDGSLTKAQAQAAINGLFHRFPLGQSLGQPVPKNITTAGIVVDDQGVAYGTQGAGLGAFAVNFAGTGSGCGVNGDSACLWMSPAITSPITNTWGIDLDQDGNPLITERSHGILGLDARTGNPLTLYQNPDMSFGTSIVGTDGNADTYTYSDFTGYALRHITQPVGVYEQIFQACPPGNQISWETMTYSATLPPGSDLAFQLDSANDPAAFANQGTGGPQLIGSWSCASAASCPSPAALMNLGNASYVRATVQLKGPPCSTAGAPVLRSLQLSYDCVPSITQ